MQVTIISGASRGIGKAIAEGLEGEKITLSSKDVDFINYLDVFAYVSSRLEEYKDITQLNIILCAARIGKCNSIDPIQFDRLFRVNVCGNFAVIEASLVYKVPKRVVWFAGGGAAFPYPEFFGYSLSKVAVVRAVENLAVSGILGKDSSIIALAPGAVETDMLKTVLDAGCEVRTRTDISESVNFVRKFITDEMDSLSLNGRFIHVRDILDKETLIHEPQLFKLRRIE